MNPIKTVPAQSWRDITHKLLVERPRSLTYDEISKHTGISVPWLRDFAGGRRENPGICTVQALYEFLTTRA